MAQLSKLTSRQIVQLHQLHKQGISNKEIAKTLGLNRNSITAHLAGEIAYTASVYRQIRIEAPLVTDRWLTLRQAAAWIPSHPSPSKLQHFVLGRSWTGLAIPRLRTKMVGRRRMTTIASIRSFVAQTYPKGIWVTQDTLMNVVPWDTIRKIEFERLGWNSGAARHLGSPLHACRLLVANRVAEEDGLSLDFPAEIVHRGTKIERYIGTAVV